MPKASTTRRSSDERGRRCGGQDREASGDAGPLAPARELYGDMLLERGMAKEALAAFEASKQKEPNRFHGLPARPRRPRGWATRPRRKRTTRSSWPWSVALNRIVARDCAARRYVTAIQSLIGQAANLVSAYGAFCCGALVDWHKAALANAQAI